EDGSSVWLTIASLDVRQQGSSPAGGTIQSLFQPTSEKQRRDTSSESLGCCWSTCSGRSRASRVRGSLNSAPVTRAFRSRGVLTYSLSNSAWLIILRTAG